LQLCDHIDLPEMKPVVTRINIHSGSCVHCGKRISGTQAAGMLPDSPFGSGIAALVIYLHTRHMVPARRLSIAETHAYRARGEH
jgi:transposase